MALDHRRLIRPGKKIPAEFFAFDKFTLQTVLPTNLGACKPSTVFIMQTSDNRMQYFTILPYKLLSFNIQDDRSTRGL